MGRILWTSEDKTWNRWGHAVERILKRSLFLLKKKHQSVEFHLVRNAIIQELNLVYRKKNTPTNVLSFTVSVAFPRPDISPKTIFLGEIYLAPSYIKAHKESLEYLAIHGLLHLLGYTHERARDKIIMEKAERRLWKRLFPHKPFIT